MSTWPKMGRVGKQDPSFLARGRRQTQSPLMCLEGGGRGSTHISWKITKDKKGGLRYPIGSQQSHTDDNPVSLGQPRSFFTCDPQTTRKIHATRPGSSPPQRPFRRSTHPATAAPQQPSPSR